MPKTVMIVEDHELNMKLFHDVLEAHGYHTICTREPTEAALHRQRLYGAVSQKKGGRGDRLCDEGRRGAHPRRGLPSLFVEADLGAQVHRDHPPLSRGRLEHAGRSPRQRNRRPLARGTSNIELEASWARVRVAACSPLHERRLSEKTRPLTQLTGLVCRDQRGAGAGEGAYPASADTVSQALARSAGR